MPDIGTAKFGETLYSDFHKALLQKLASHADVLEPTFHAIDSFPFHSVIPKTEKKCLRSKSPTHPENASIGPFTQVLALHRGRAANELDANAYFTSRQHKSCAVHAGFKLHLSISNIADKKTSDLIDLAGFLVNKSTDAKNNIKFQFKIACQKISVKGKLRFSQTEQFTIYFDRYSSIKDMLDFKDQVDDYMKVKFPGGNDVKPEKDIIIFSQFVSGRTALVSLTEQYPQSTMMTVDTVLGEFFKRHPRAKLQSVPMCVIDKAINMAILESRGHNNGIFTCKLRDYLDEAVQDPDKFMEIDCLKPTGAAAGIAKKNLDIKLLKMGATIFGVVCVAGVVALIISPASIIAVGALAGSLLASLGTSAAGLVGGAVASKAVAITVGSVISATVVGAASCSLYKGLQAFVTRDLKSKIANGTSAAAEEGSDTGISASAVSL